MWKLSFAGGEKWRDKAGLVVVNERMDETTSRLWCMDRRRYMIWYRNVTLFIYRWSLVIKLPKYRSRPFHVSLVFLFCIPIYRWANFRGQCTVQYIQSILKLVRFSANISWKLTRRHYISVNDVIRILWVSSFSYLISKTNVDQSASFT